MLWLYQENVHTKSKQDVSQTREDVARIRSALKVKIVSNFRAGKFLETRTTNYEDWQETQASAAKHKLVWGPADSGRTLLRKAAIPLCRGTSGSLVYPL